MIVSLSRSHPGDNCEGKVPSRELAGLALRFRGWLRYCETEIVQIHDKPLTISTCLRPRMKWVEGPEKSDLKPVPCNRTSGPPASSTSFSPRRIRMQRFTGRAIALGLSVGLMLPAFSSTALAPYKLAKLTSNVSGQAKNTDSLLVNGWGLVYAPGGPFWISDNGTGWSPLFDGIGTPQT